MRPELVIAEKELRDHVVSKRFLVILAVLLLLSVYGVYTGMGAYEAKIEQYKNSQSGIGRSFIQQNTIESLQKQIQYAEAHGEPEENTRYHKDQLNYLTNPPMPSILEIFNGMVVLFTFLGMVLGRRWASTGYQGSGAKARLSSSQYVPYIGMPLLTVRPSALLPRSPSPWPRRSSWPWRPSCSRASCPGRTTRRELRRYPYFHYCIVRSFSLSP